MEQRTPRSEIESKPTANGWNARADFSPEEIESLLDGIDSVVSTYKAEREGIDPKDMVKTVRGGKTVWITKSEMNQILAKQRKISGVKYAQRSLRGEDSLSSEINRRIQVCYELIVTVRRLLPEEGLRLTPLFRNLESMHNRVLGVARDLRMLEQAIQRKRAEDDVFSTVNNASATMADAVMKGNLDEAELCRQHCDRHMEQFVAKEKRLKPYLDKAREFRTDFIQSRQKLLIVEFELLLNIEVLLREQLPELIYYDRKVVFVGELCEQADLIRDQVIKAKPYFEREWDWGETADEESIRKIAQMDKDYLSPLLRSLTMYCRNFEKAWNQLIVPAKNKKNVKKETPVETHPGNEAEPKPSTMDSGVWVSLNNGDVAASGKGVRPSMGYHSNQTESES